MGVEFDIGTRLRQLREVAGLSQRALAKRAGITNSTVSLLEANRTNPSVGALKRILDAIPVSLADFFTFEFSTDGPCYAESELLEIGRGPVSIVRSARRRQDGNFRFCPNAINWCRYWPHSAEPRR